MSHDGRLKNGSMELIQEARSTIARRIAARNTRSVATCSHPAARNASQVLVSSPTPVIKSALEVLAMDTRLLSRRALLTSLVGAGASTAAVAQTVEVLPELVRPAGQEPP